MGEKRFFVKVYSNNEPFFFDEKQEYVEKRYTCEDVRNLHPMEYWQVVELLNEQQELIEELQEENKQLKLTLSEYGVDLKAFEIFKQKIGYYDKVIDDE